MIEPLLIAKSLKVDLSYAACPVAFWDVYGESGHPVRTMGSSVGREIIRGVLGSILGKRR